MSRGEGNVAPDFCTDVFYGLLSFSTREMKQRNTGIFSGRMASKMSVNILYERDAKNNDEINLTIYSE